MCRNIELQASYVIYDTHYFPENKTQPFDLKRLCLKSPKI